MDHAEAREMLELAAVEPGGLDRLMAGDTADAAAVAGHLAGCPDCTAAMARLRRDAVVIASVVRSTPPPALRDRTLAYVAQIGRDRSASPVVPLAGVGPGAGGRRESRPLSSSRAAVLAALAAVFLVAVAGTSLILAMQSQSLIAARDTELARQADIVKALSRVTTWTLRVEAEPDVHRVELAGPPGTSAYGTILFSPTSRELVVVATGLVEPAAGREFRCWVDDAGARKPVGRMFFGGDLSYWAGSLDALGALGANARFGISLVDAGGSSVDGDPVLSGDLRQG